MKILTHYGQINQNILGYIVPHTGPGPLMARLTTPYGMWERTAPSATTTSAPTIASITGFAQL